MRSIGKRLISGFTAFSFFMLQMSTVFAADPALAPTTSVAPPASAPAASPAPAPVTETTNVVLSLPKPAPVVASPDPKPRLELSFAPDPVYWDVQSQMGGMAMTQQGKALGTEGCNGEVQVSYDTQTGKYKTTCESTQAIALQLQVAGMVSGQLLSGSDVLKDPSAPKQPSMWRPGHTITLVIVLGVVAAGTVCAMTKCVQITNENY